MSIPVGLTIPKLLPITGTFVLPLTAYYVFLQDRIVYHRLSTNTVIGDHIKSSSSESPADNDVLFASCVAQKNFAENVPLALTLAAVVELNGGSRRALTWALSILTVARVLHADFGIMQKDQHGFGRPLGYWMTQGVVGGLAGYAAYLVKGYWDL